MEHSTILKIVCCRKLLVLLLLANFFANIKCEENVGTVRKLVPNQSLWNKEMNKDWKHREIPEELESENSVQYITEPVPDSETFQSSINNDSLILTDLVKCLKDLKFTNCLKILLLRRVYSLLDIMNEQNVQHSDFTLLNGLISFKYRPNNTSDSSMESSSEEPTQDEYQDLDKELSTKIKELFRDRSVLLNLRPGFGYELTPKRDNGMISFSAKAFRSSDSSIEDTSDESEESEESEKRTSNEKKVKTGGVNGVNNYNNNNNNNNNNNQNSNKSKRKKKKDSGFGLKDLMPMMPMMMVPQMVMMGLLPMALSNIKMMVMNAFMMNSMALGRALMTTIRNMVFGARGGPRIKYVNYGYKKNNRPDVIVHSPAAFVKQPEHSYHKFNHQNVPEHNEIDYNSFLPQASPGSGVPFTADSHYLPTNSFHGDHNSLEDSYSEPSTYQSSFNDQNIKVKRPTHGSTFKIIRKKVVPAHNSKKVIKVKVKGKPDINKIQQILNTVNQPVQEFYDKAKPAKTYNAEFFKPDSYEDEENYSTIKDEGPSNQYLQPSYPPYDNYQNSVHLNEQVGDFNSQNTFISSASHDPINLDSSSVFNFNKYEPAQTEFPFQDFKNMRYNPYEQKHYYDGGENIQNREYIFNRETKLVNHKIPQEPPEFPISPASISYTNFKIFPNQRPAAKYSERAESREEDHEHLRNRNVFSAKYNKDLVKFEASESKWHEE